MSPTIGRSIRRVRDNLWVLGTLMVCEWVLKPQESSIASWTDHDGKLFHVRAISQEEQELYPANPDTRDHIPDRIHRAGSSAAVWRIGDTFIKVKSWVEGLELESDTIAFVNQTLPSIPVPEILCTWIDYAYNRTFLILKEVEGQTLLRAWPSLTVAQRQDVADKVASFCQELATKTSLKLESATGCGVLENFLSAGRPATHPSWKPDLLGPFSLEETRAYLAKINPAAQLEFGDVFHYYHADLGPTNIIVSDEGHVEGVIDWESAGYFPRFHIGTKPCVSAGFSLEGLKGEEWAWASLLAKSLEKDGFPADMEIYRSWRKAVRPKAAA